MQPAQLLPPAQPETLLIDDAMASLVSADNKQTADTIELALVRTAITLTICPPTMSVTVRADAGSAGRSCSRAGHLGAQAWDSRHSRPADRSRRFFR